MPKRKNKSTDNEVIVPAHSKSYIIIRQASDVIASQKARRYGENHLKPIIDFTGEFKDFADLSLNAVATNTLAKIEEISHLFQSRAAVIPLITRAHSDETYRFLSWLYVSQQDYKLIYDPSTKLGVSYTPFCPVSEGATLAHRLYERGLLSRKFFDRFHQCASCQSTRVNVREECMTCRSAHIEEVQIIHHFTCAWQGPESDYIQGRDLVCPKCKKHLTHYGSDYEKSGIVMHCHDCEEDHSTASVGFICLDCEAHQDSETMKTVSYYEYALSENGIKFLLESQPEERPYKAEPRALTDDSSLHITNLPLELQQEIVALKLGLAPSRNDGIHPFVLMEISYKNAFALILAIGEKDFSKLRHRLHDNLRSEIREHDVFSQGLTSDYLLLKETDKNTILAKNSTFLKRCQHEIDHDLGIVIRVLDGKELSYSE